MAAKQHGTVIGVFQNHDEARAAIRELKDAGFTEDQIGVASSNKEGLRSVQGDDAGDESYAGEGAITGVAAGAGIGALWGLGILAGILPAIGPAIAGGTLAVILSSAAAGAAAAGLTGALIGMGISKEEAEFYESEMQAGRTIVTVNANTRRHEAVAILQQHGGYDMSSRLSVAQQGQPGSEAIMASGAACPTGLDDATAGAGNTVQAREEQLHVQKTPVETGEVTVRKEMHTEHKTLEVPVTREEVVVERHPASGQAASSSDLQSGQEIRVPVTEEQVNVEKQAVVSEEVSVGKRTVQDTQRIDETVRKEDIKIETAGDVNVRDERK